MADAADNSLRENQILDGYRLIRPLGCGGFGQVWLCRSEAVGDLHALKFIAASNPDVIEKEFGALLLYRRAVARVGSPHLVPIEHINRTGDGLYYIMPLADRATSGDPEDPSWMPLTLAESIRQKAAGTTWFTAEEIVSMFVPILEGLQVLSDAGLVHRDVKPDNILFLDGRPCLGDISLLRKDAQLITNIGTYGYTAPAWYKGGHPDMYGAAVTLYTLITGNLPDCLGRSAFEWPNQDATMIAENDRRRWKDFHSIIRRAMEEKFSERFPDFIAMARALRNTLDTPTSAGELSPRISSMAGTPTAVAQLAPPPMPPPPQSAGSKRKAGRRGWVYGALTLLLLGFSGWIASGVMGPSGRLRNMEEDTVTDSADQPASVIAQADSGGVSTPSPVPPAKDHTASTPEVAGNDGTNPRTTAVPQVPFTPPKVDRSYRDYRKDGSDSEDERLAYNSLAWFMEKDGLLTPDERKKLGDSLARIDVIISDPTGSDLNAAARFVESAMKEIPAIGKSTNAKLARLLFLYLEGDHGTSLNAQSDPDLRILGDDELAYRVALMDHLRMNPDPLLDQLINSPETNVHDLVPALMERARLRAAYGDEEGGRQDVVSALKLSAADPKMRAWVEQEMDDLRRGDERFARELQGLPEK